MSETTQNLGTLTWFQEGGFYWLDGELTNQLQLYPVKKMDWDDGITDHSGAPEKLVFGDITFTKLYDDDNVYQTDIIGAEGAYSLMDIDGTGYYTGFMGSPLTFTAFNVIVDGDASGETVSKVITVSGNSFMFDITARADNWGVRIGFRYVASATNIATGSINIGGDFTGIAYVKGDESQKTWSLYAEELSTDGTILPVFYTENVTSTSTSNQGTIYLKAVYGRPNYFFARLRGHHMLEPIIFS